MIHILIILTLLITLCRGSDHSFHKINNNIVEFGGHLGMDINIISSRMINATLTCDGLVYGECIN